MAEIDVKSSMHPKAYPISAENLPLSCPLPEMSAWNNHPKVFLKIEESKRVVCPYCGTLYILK